MDAAPPSKAKIFLRRLISSVILWTIVLIGLFSSNPMLSNYLFLTIIVVLAVTGLAEFYGLAQKRDLVSKFSDTGAYSVGSLIGKHKMIPRISPGKTWEGFAGAILFSMLASLIFVHFLGHKMRGMNMTHAMVLGLILGLCAVIGDLIESLFK